ncbi:hypothetical protein EDB89DRAFT_1592295 [Lactarius sanguifluus]|nr:hypothetical protein EDB89DRAFT_1592295 [Lactarius sanguifluus]
MAFHRRGRRSVSGTLDSMNATQQECPPSIEFQTRSYFPEVVSAVDEIQESIHSAPKPSSQGLADPAAAESSTTPASGLESCPLAPAQADTRATQAPAEPAEIPAPQSTQAIIGSNAPRGLAASMHALKGCLPSHAKREIAGHSADAPNWAAAAREDSTAASRGSSLAQRGKTSDQGLDDGDESDVPTATRCTIRGENEMSGVDDSDGSMHPAADDRDGVAVSSETDSGLDAADGLNEQESATRSRRSRRRGKPLATTNKGALSPSTPNAELDTAPDRQHACRSTSAAQTSRLGRATLLAYASAISLNTPLQLRFRVRSSPQAVVSDQLGQSPRLSPYTPATYGFTSRRQIFNHHMFPVFNLLPLMRHTILYYILKTATETTGLLL